MTPVTTQAVIHIKQPHQSTIHINHLHIHQAPTSSSLQQAATPRSHQQAACSKQPPSVSKNQQISRALLVHPIA
jgi:hypothetical protein